jgi:predicted ATP-grasp superfamily ATP-dependent carboligase
MKKLFVGPKQATIEYSDFFDGSITLFGENNSKNISYNETLSFEFWNPDNNEFEISIYNKEISKLQGLTQIMAHNPLLVSKCKLLSNVQQICLNEIPLLEKLDNKIEMRKYFKNLVPSLDYVYLTGADINSSILKNIAKVLIIQSPIGSGGAKTYFCNKDTFKTIQPLLKPFETYIISKYQNQNIPLNIHCIIGNKNIEILPPSLQLLEINNKIEYIGSEYDISGTLILPNLKNQLIEYSNLICSKLQKDGYRGVLGLDYIYVEEKLFFIEINPRFQGSTRQVDKLLKDSNLPSIFKYNFDAFYKDKLISTKKMKNSIFIKR